MENGRSFIESSGVKLQSNVSWVRGKSRGLAGGSVAGSVAGERIHMDPPGARATCRGPQRSHTGGRAGDEDHPAADVGDQLLEGRRIDPS